MRLDTPQLRKKVLEDRTPFIIVNLTSDLNRKLREHWPKPFWSPTLPANWGAVRIQEFRPNGAFYSKDSATLSQYCPDKDVEKVDAKRLIVWIETGEILPQIK